MYVFGERGPLVPRSAWQDYLDEQQSRNLKLIAVCAAVVQLFGIVRDFIVEDVTIGDPVVIVSFATFLIAAPIAARTFVGGVSHRHAQLAAAVVVASIMARPLAIMAVRDINYPMYQALIVFALGVCLLDYRYLTGAIGLILIPWTAIALVSLPTAQAAQTLAMILVSAVMAHFVMRSRINAHIRLVELQNRVSNLESLLPLCSHCKNTRLENGKWIRIEEYLVISADKSVTHSICPDCLRKHYPDFADDVIEGKRVVSN